MGTQTNSDIFGTGSVLASARHREAVLGQSKAGCPEQVRHLNHLFDLFEGDDAEEEVRRLKEQDEGF